MTKNNNPWMASSAYQEADFYKFKGRDEDTQHLLTMLLQNESVICYAASGEGKSSLINAGVCPELRKNGLFPIKITFTTAEYQGEGLPKNSEGKIDFDKLIAEKIDLDIRRNIQSCIEKFHLAEGEYTIAFEKIPKYNNVEISNSLWWKLRTETIQVPFGEYDYIPILIFDQFEEIFRAKWKADFFIWLEELMRDVCPDNIVAKFDGSNDDLPNGKLFKTLFSMRYEYVGELDYWCSQKTYIPQMMLNRYFLKPLSLKQAVSIIENQDIEDEVSNKLRNSSASIADGIKNKETDEDQVSAIILSIVCYDLYEKLYSEQNFTINEENINEVINHSISSFYENAISRIKRKGSDNCIPLKHIKIIENVLVDEKGHRLRLPVDISELKEIDFERDYREALETAHLIRSYKVNDETYVELIHDRIADVIVEKRSIEQKRSQRLMNVLKIAILVLSLIGIILGCICFKQQDDNKKLNAENGKLLGNDKLIININLKEDDAVKDLWWEANLIVTAKMKTKESYRSDTFIINKTTADSTFTISPIEKKDIQSLFIRLKYKDEYTKFHEIEDTIERDSVINIKQPIKIPIRLRDPVLYGGQVVMSDSIGKATNHQIENAIVILGNEVTFTDGQGKFLFELQDSVSDSTEFYVIKKGYKKLSNLSPSLYLLKDFPQFDLKKISFAMEDPLYFYDGSYFDVKKWCLNDRPYNKNELGNLKNGKKTYEVNGKTVMLWQKDLSIKYEGKYQSEDTIHFYLIFDGDIKGEMKVRGYYFYGKENDYCYHCILNGESQLQETSEGESGTVSFRTFELTSIDIAHNKETIKGKYYTGDKKNRPWELNIFINDTKKIAESVIPDQ